MRRTSHVTFMVLSVNTIAAGPRSAPVSQLSAPITIAVDAAVNRQPIDPRINGLAFVSQLALVW